MSGGAGPKKRGTAFEHTIKGHLRKRGWPTVVRSYASKGPWDVCAIRGISAFWHEEREVQPEVWLVQAKVGGRMSPAERVALVASAHAIGATPVMATTVARRVTYFLVTALTDRHMVLDPGAVVSISDTGVSDEHGEPDPGRTVPAGSQPSARAVGRGSERLG